MHNVLKITPLTFVACAESNKRLIITVQESDWYSGPGKPKNVALNLDLQKTYENVNALAERVFGAGKLNHSCEGGKHVFYVSEYTQKSPEFFNCLIALSRGKTLDMILDSLSSRK